MVEGVVLYNEGINPYAGDIFHETPLVLWLFSKILDQVSPTFINVLFIVCDIITSYLLYKGAKIYSSELVSMPTGNVLDADLLINYSQFSLKRYPRNYGNRLKL